MAEFFGFEINRKKKGPERPSFVPDTESDGAGVITTGGHFGVYLDLDGDKAKTEIDLLLKYRDVARQPECDAAIEDIGNEAITASDVKPTLELNLDKIPLLLIPENFLMYALIFDWIIGFINRV